MTVEVVADATALARRAADIVCGAAREHPRIVLGLPTGATPIGTYAELGRRAAAGACDLGNCTAFAIDEFAGVPRATPGTNAAFFAQHLRVPLAALRVPDAETTDPGKEIRTFAASVARAGGLDLCLLGIGVNGHIGFNEPPSARDATARAVDLDEATRAAHAEAFGSLAAVPQKGMTLGVAEIMAARRVVVLVSGAHKAAIVALAIEGPQGADVPASWLRDHASVTWLIDAAAAAGLGSRGARE